MFLAIRDIRFAKGRFALMGSVVALITLLLVMLSGLTAGLGNQSTSALGALPVQQIAFGAPAGAEPKASYTESEVSAGQLAAWRDQPGVASAEALGISQTRFQSLSDGGTPAGTANVAVFGGGLAPSAVEDGTVAVGESLAKELALDVGSRVRAGGTDLRVSAVVEDQWYSHTGVVWTSLDTWRSIAHAAPGSATVIAATFDDGASVDVDAANAAAGTVSTDPVGSFQALASYKSENGSLMLMQAFLYGISALVIVAFLTVWTVQRTRDIAVLKALGASSAYVLRDALTQAAMVLLAGAFVGGLLGLAGGFFASQAAPFLITPLTTLVPMVGIILLGLAGAVLAVRSVTKVDPLLALGGN
ncbi:ABC transporter permease [Paenarthrobacter aurescens]|uniref:ABC transporter substrate-binding protein n=1 Tax=Paenarthrobacter aurescens TaxID=43663 RepID=A0A4Y3NE25_PAEAU|nr:ABC transporter permease [Paenarthrobacter aurescens]MDO6141676.1 ABC transporter permease [Paenarthrobacter aurescens]MDO6149439.1 ABC transporter permease [Paenarthrobacter aurescens]MDO6156725.1 ABC transporter permease [Paenarthrobacter aurescens]MDO6160711.1 ABC transporter permease [Paenarthrobacter aurescens]GEB18675.1 ABC transporter substrate-binding protein [Paenarthrobacter aurescens]